MVMIDSIFGYKYMELIWWENWLEKAKTKILKGKGCTIIKVYNSELVEVQK